MVELEYQITLKFDRCLSSTAAEAPVEFESDTIIKTTILIDFTKSQDKLSLIWYWFCSLGLLLLTWININLSMEK